MSEKIDPYIVVGIAFAAMVFGAALTSKIRVAEDSAARDKSAENSGLGAKKVILVNSPIEIGGMLRTTKNEVTCRGYFANGDFVAVRADDKENVAHPVRGNPSLADCVVAGNGFGSSK